MIYLHGFASGPTSSKAQSFRRRFAELGVDLEVPALDEGDFEHLTIARMLEVVAGRLSDVKAPRVLIGSSLGGYLSVLHAARHPVEALVLMAPAVDFHSRLVDRHGQAALDDWRRTGFTEVDHYVHLRPMRLGAGFLDDAARHDPRPQVSTPTLVFQGRRDDVVPLPAVEEWVAQQPSAELVVLDDDHSLTASIDEILGRTVDFLASLQLLPAGVRR